MATLIAVTGDWDLAEECAQDAFTLGAADLGKGRGADPARCVAHHHRPQPRGRRAAPPGQRVREAPAGGPGSPNARGPGALLLALSISLDELAIGFTLGLLRLPAVLVIALIALQAFIVAQLWSAPRLPAERTTAGNRRTTRRPRSRLALAIVLLAEELLA